MLLDEKEIDHLAYKYKDLIFSTGLINYIFGAVNDYNLWKKSKSIPYLVLKNLDKYKIGTILGDINVYAVDNTNGISLAAFYNFSKTGESFILIKKRLLKLPKFMIDFVILHELGHYVNMGVAKNKIEEEYNADLYAANLVGFDNVINARRILDRAIDILGSRGSKIYEDLDKKILDEKNRRISSGQLVERKVKLDISLNPLSKDKINISHFSENIKSSEVSLLNDKIKIHLVLFTAADSPFSKLITLKMKKYSHSALSFNGKTIYELQLGNIRKVDIDKYPGFRYADFYSLEVTNTRLLLDMIRYLSSVKINYNFLSLIKIVLGNTKTKKLPNIEKMLLQQDHICSSFVATVLYQSNENFKKYVDDNNFKLDTITPMDLYRFPDLKFERRILINNPGVDKDD